MHRKARASFEYSIDSLTFESPVHLASTTKLCVSLQSRSLFTASFQVQRLLSYYLITTLTLTLSGKRNCYFQSVGKIPHTHELQETCFDVYTTGDLSRASLKMYNCYSSPTLRNERKSNRESCFRPPVGRQRCTTHDFDVVSPFAIEESGEKVKVFSHSQSKGVL